MQPPGPDWSIYVWPEKLGPQIVVAIGAGLATLWLSVFLAHVARIIRALIITRRFEKILNALSQDVVTRPAGQSDSVQAQHAFRSHVLPARIPPLHPVAEHVLAVFSAGYSDSRLETTELFRKTEEQVCSLDGVVRATIGLFVILGLLGTLIGVADAVALLTAGNARPDIQDFLNQLKGAFAPSLLGVAVSVLWVVLYAAVALPLRSRFRTLLRERTVREWVPRLLPSTSQRITEAAQHTLEAARKVVEFAAGIEESSERWNRSVSASAEAAKTISAAMVDMKEAVSNADAVLRGTLSDLGQKMQGFSAALVEWNSISERVTEFQSAVLESQRRQTETGNQIRDHATRLADTTDSLRTELRESLEGLRGATTQLFAPVSSAARDLEDIGKAFAETCTGLIDGLRSELGSQIRGLRSTHHESLEAARDFFNTLSGELSTKSEDVIRRLQNLREPFDRAAGNVADATTAAVTRWDTLIQDFNRRTDNLIAAVRETHVVVQPPPTPPPSVLTAERWNALMERLAGLQAPGGTQAVIESLGRLQAELSRIRGELSRMSGMGSSTSVPTQRPVPDYGVGERANTVHLPRGRRRDD